MSSEKKTGVLAMSDKLKRNEELKKKILQDFPDAEVTVKTYGVKVKTYQALVKNGKIKVSLCFCEKWVYQESHIESLKNYNLTEAQTIEKIEPLLNNINERASEIINGVDALQEEFNMALYVDCDYGAGNVAIEFTYQDISCEYYI